MSERVLRAVELTAERAAAAVGQSVNGWERVHVAAGSVSPDEIARRMVAGLLELEEIEPLFDHTARRADFTARSLADSESFESLVASLWLALLQCFVQGVLFARGGEVSVGSGSVPLERPPARESAAALFRPTHGGFPGSTV